MAQGMAAAMVHPQRWGGIGERRQPAVCPSLTPFVFCWLLGDKLFFSKSQFSVPHGMIDLSLCQVTLLSLAPSSLSCPALHWS